MAHQENRLLKIGKEGFDLLDELYPKKKKPVGPGVPISKPQASDHFHHQYYNHNNQQQYVYRFTKVYTVREPVIDNNQAVQFYGGTDVVDHGIGKPMPGAY